MQSDSDVVVVGAGPTGLALALQATDHGARVRVVERRREYARPSRALIVHPRTLEVLRPLGVTDALLDRGDGQASAHVHLGSRVVRAELRKLEIPDTAFPHLLLIRQADVEAVLAKALADRGLEIERGAEVVRVESVADRAIVTTSHGDDLHARFVVGCDGPDSLVRTSISVTWSGGPYRHEVVLADVELGGDVEPDALHAVPGPQGLLFLFPLGEHASWRLLATRPACTPTTQHGQPGPPLARTELQDLLDRSGFGASIEEVQWSARIPVQHRLAGAYGSGPVFLAGDAAHAHSPAGGLGMNTGIQDATNLGWKLALAALADRDRAGTLLASYELERRPVALRVLALSNLIFWAEASTDCVASTSRSLIRGIGPVTLPMLLRRRRLIGAGLRTLGQMDVNYRRSPLSITGTRPRGQRRAGDRLGDAAVMTASGLTHLQGLTAHPGIGLLVQRDAWLPDLATTPRQVLTHHLEEAGTGVAAIRPDGYVGFSGDCADHDLLRAWLSLCLLLEAAPRADDGGP